MQREKRSNRYRKPFGALGLFIACGSCTGAPATSGLPLVQRETLERSARAFPEFALLEADAEPIRSEVAALRVELPETEDAPMRITTRGYRFDVSFRVRGRPAHLEQVGRLGFYGERRFFAALDGRISDGAWISTRFEEFELAEAGAARWDSSFDILLPPAITHVRSSGTYLEFWAGSLPLARLHYPVARDEHGETAGGSVRFTGAFDHFVPSVEPSPTLRLEVGERVLAVHMEVDLRRLRDRIVIDPGWSSTGSMGTPRTLHAASMLPDGRVLVTGGTTAAVGPTVSCEIYDPATGTWSAASPLTHARSAHGQFVLADGSVVVVNGTVINGPTSGRSVEIYDPVSDVWSPGAQPPNVAGTSKATMLADGRILIAGSSPANLYDPVAGTWSVTGPHNASWGGSGGAFALLPTGKVLAADFSNGELYDPVTNTWSIAAAPGFSGFEAVMLSNGKLLAAGGCAPTCGTSLAKLYDPLADAWQAVGNLVEGRQGHRLVQLPGQTVLAAGGSRASAPTLQSAEMYDVAAGGWTSVAQMIQSRQRHSATLLPNGKVLVAGGDANSQIRFTSELYGNRPPIAQDVFVSMSEDDARGFLLAGTDPDGDSLSFEVLSTPLNGSLSGMAPNLVYTPAANFSGSDSFTFRVSDGQADSANSGTVSIVVAPVDDAPVAQDGTVATDEDTPAAVVLGASDPDGDGLTFSIVSPPTHGSLTGVAPDLTYRPAANYFGPDSFAFRANDGTGDSNVATVSITVGAVNDPPSASDLSLAGSEDSPVAISLVASDVEGGPLTWTIVGGPVSGALSGTGQNLVYSPGDNFFGTDTFTYGVNDGEAASGAATVTITISPLNDAPQATASTVAASEDTAVGFFLQATDVDGDALAFTVLSPPTAGTVSGTPPGLVFTPSPDFNGTTTLTFRASDGALDSNTEVVTFTVSAVNDAPITSDVAATGSEGSAIPVTLAAGDPDGDPLTWEIVTDPSNGSLSGMAPTLTFTPDPGFAGTDSFTFRASDGTAFSNVSMATITVTPLNVAPSVSPISVATLEDTPVAVTLEGSDVNGDALVWTIVSGPDSGVLSGIAPALTFTPSPDMHGTATFSYKASDGALDSEVAVVTISVTPVNDLPVAAADSYAAVEDTALTVPPAGGVLANDMDPDSAMLAASVVSGPTHGQIFLAAEGGFTYIPSPNYEGADSFTYQVSDGAATSQPVVVTVGVAAVNDPPYASGDGYQVDEDGTLSLDPASGLLAGDSDADGDALIVSLSAPPANGTVTVMPDGAFVYVPAPNYSGSDSFVYELSDGTAVAEGVVAIAIAPVNDSPIVTGEAFDLVEDSLLTVLDPGEALLANDLDVEGDALSIVIEQAPAHGSLEIGQGGTFSYAPDSDYSGADGFSYRVDDGSAQSQVATVTLLVAPVNDAPSRPAAISPAENDELADGAVAFSWSASSEPDGDPVEYTVRVTRNGELIEELPSTSLSVSVSDDLSPGEYEWTLEGTDPVGATEGPTLPRRFVVAGGGGGRGGSCAIGLREDATSTEATMLLLLATVTLGVNGITRRRRDRS